MPYVRFFNGDGPLDGDLGLMGERARLEEAEAAIVEVLDRIGAEADGEFEFYSGVRTALASMHEAAANPSDGTASSDEAGRVVQPALWAFEYHVTFEGEDMNGRPRFQSRQHFANDSLYPPLIDQLSEEATDVWERLAGRCSAPAVTAHLEHLLFVRRRGNGRDRARAAAGAYLKLTSQWSSRLDHVTALRLALDLARATGQDDLANETLRAVVATAQTSLEAEKREPGVALRLIELAASDRSPLAEVDELLQRARETYEDPFILDDVIALQAKRASGDEEEVNRLHDDRIRVWMDAAERTDSIVRPIHMMRAIEHARNLGRRELLDESTSRLQETRLEDLGLKSFRTGVSISRSDVDEALRPVLDAESWAEALDAFARFGPITGDIDRNRETVAQHAVDFPLSALFPHHRIGGDGLPRFLAETDEQRAEFALAQHESMYIQLGANLICEALMRITTHHGLPTEAELTSYFGRNPIVDTEVARAIARAFLRFWAGDAEAAAYTIAPRIETLARELLVRMNVAIYRTQVASSPGQYPGLGFLLSALLAEGLDPSWHRFIFTLCANPAGVNLRNEMLHGLIGPVGNVWASLLLQSAAYLALLQPGLTGDQPRGTGSD